MLVSENWVRSACLSLSHLPSVVWGMLLKQVILRLYQLEHAFVFPITAAITECFPCSAQLVPAFFQWANLRNFQILVLRLLTIPRKIWVCNTMRKIRSELLTKLNLFILRVWWHVPIIPALRTRVSQPYRPFLKRKENQIKSGSNIHFYGRAFHLSCN